MRGFDSCCPCMKKRKFRRSIPSYFPPVYRARKLSRGSKFKLHLSRPLRPNKLNRSLTGYVGSHRLSSNYYRPKPGSTPLSYFYSFKKKNWVFTSKAYALNTSVLGIIASASIRRGTKFGLTVSLILRDATLLSFPLVPYFLSAPLGRGVEEDFGSVDFASRSPLPVALAGEPDITSYCALSGISGWFFLKKRLSLIVPPSKNVVLGYGFKRFIIDNPIFHPHAEDVRVFRSLVFCSFDREYGLREVASSSSVLAMLLGLKKYTFRRQIRFSLSRSLLYMLRVGIKPPLPKFKKRRSIAPRKKSRVRYRVVLQQLTRLKWRLRKNRNVMRRTLAKLEARVNSPRPPRSHFLEKYNAPRFFTHSAHNLVPASLQRRRDSSLKPLRAGRTLARNYVQGLLSHAHSSSATRQPFSKELALLYFFQSPLFLKVFFFRLASPANGHLDFSNSALTRLLYRDNSLAPATNLSPSTLVRSVLVKKILANQTNSFLHKHALPWAHNSLIRFMEDCSGKRVMLQVYSFITQNIDNAFLALYRRWMSGMRYYEQRLGRKFFLGEALSIIHPSFTMHGPKLLISWFSAIIKRISFWKTRLVFRFLGI